MLQELQIQSNLPLIILTILVICIVVIGYLELKKVHNSIDTLNNRIDSLKKNETKINIKDNSLKQPIQSNMNLNDKEINIYSDIPSEQFDSNSDKLNTPEELNTQEELNTSSGELDNMSSEMNGVPPGFPIETMMASMPFGNIVLQGGPILPMGFEAKNMDDTDMTFEEEDIDNNQEINEQQLTEENIQEINEINNLVEEINQNDKESNISELSNSDEEDSSEEDSSDEEDSDKDSDKESEVNKNINFNPVIQIDESLSVKQLKIICEDMNIPQSGNKSQLIQRIKQHQK